MKYRPSALQGLPRTVICVVRPHFRASVRAACTTCLCGTGNERKQEGKYASGPDARPPLRCGNLVRATLLSSRPTAKRNGNRVIGHYLLDVKLGQAQVVQGGKQTFSRTEQFIDRKPSSLGGVAR